MLIRLVKLMISAVRVLNRAIAVIRIFIKPKSKKKNTGEKNKS